MSDHIPFHIQEEILERLPVKSLIKFRSVSKSWRSLIDSSHFIASHSRHRHTQPEHLLVKYRDQNGHENVSLVDDDAFPQQRFAQTIPLSVKRSLFPKIIGSSHGLSCVEVNDPEVVIWNPSIRKSITIWLPSILYHKFPLLGFGVCPITLDPKIVGIRQCFGLCDTTNKSIMNHCKAMVYRLSSGKWREFSNDSLPRRAAGAMYPAGPQVIIDSSIYWLAYYSRSTYLILSFDITNETFQVIDLPHNLACNPRSKRLSLSKLRDESLIIFESSENQLVFDVWMMKPDDVQRSFTKLYRIEAQHELVMKVVGVRRSGQPIMEVKHRDELSQLVVYDQSNLNRFRRLKINGAGNDYVVSSYEETLLFLGRSDCRSDNRRIVYLRY